MRYEGSKTKEKDGKISEEQIKELIENLPTKRGRYINGGDEKHAKTLSFLLNLVSVGEVTACPRQFPHM